MRLIVSAACAFAFSAIVFAQQDKPVGNDIPASFTPPAVKPYEKPAPETDYIKRVEMVPMRDGVKLYTVIVIPKGAKNVPIILTRTPYNAAARAAANRTPTAAGSSRPLRARAPRDANAEKPADQPKMINLLGLPDEIYVHAGWIRVYQDVRGKYGSEGVYLMTPPPVGPWNPPAPTTLPTDTTPSTGW